MSHDNDPRSLAVARVGQTLNGKWHLDRVLDVGGMAAVFVATHRNGKKVAVKMLLPFYAASAPVRERFLREGYAANKVDHRGAVSVLDDDITADGAPFLVMELLEGESLETWLARAGGRLTAPDVLAVADQVLDVLAAAHEKGIVHRDIKPANVFVTTEGVVKVLDFGLARMKDAQIGVAPTASGVVLGTPSYLPPEQAQGKPSLVDHRSDLFSVGALMFRALVGRPVHDGKSTTEKLVAAMQNRAKPVREVAPHVPACVADVVDKALAYERENRWQDARAMQHAVRSSYQTMRSETVNALAEAERASHHGASIDVTVEDVTDSVEESPSLVVDVSFGPMSRRTA